MPAPIAAVPNRAGGHRPAALGALPGSGYRPGGCQDATRCPPGAGSQHPQPSRGPGGAVSLHRAVLGEHGRARWAASLSGSCPEEPPI